MKKWSGIIAVTAFAMVAVADIIYNAVSNNVIQYFSEQPGRLLLVASIGITGGLLALGFERLSSRLRRSLKLYILGSAAILLSIFSGYFFVQSLALPSELTESVAGRTIVLVPLCLAAVVVLLWLEFYQVFRRRAE